MQINDVELQSLKSQIVSYPDYPKPGILFQDIWPLVGNPDSMKKMISMFADRYRNQNVDVIVGLESRGFVLGVPLAMELNIPFVPVRKKGKLPGAVVQATYEKEYGEDIFELSSHSITKGQSVVVVDDVIATGGSALAVFNLIKQLGGKVHELATLFQIEGVPRTSLGVPSFELFASNAEQVQ
ncbi:MAG: adenine phosphoribosyltransferase [Oligoflexales bacterium]